MFRKSWGGGGVGGGGCIPKYCIYGDVPPDRVWFFTSLLTGYIVSRKTVLNRVYNFVRVCPFHYPPVESIVIS